MQPSTMEPKLGVKFLSAGLAACIADAATFPLDTAKVRLQIQGEGGVAKTTAVRVHAAGNGSGALLRHAVSGGVGGVVSGGAGGAAGAAAAEFKYRGMVGTIMTICRQEGVRGLYNGLNAGLQRQMCFASIRIGLYDNVKIFYQDIFVGGPASSSQMFAIRLFAGLTTGGAAVVFAQPTDVVKVRMQAQSRAALAGGQRYTGCLDAYKKIATQEGVRGLWKGVLPNVARNAVVNVSEIVCYDIIKEAILSYRLLTDGVPCHFVSAVAAGFATTVLASPVDVVKTRYMNSRPDQYRGAIDCAVRMFREGGAGAFYKGFIPNFSRFVSWNICMWLSYEQLKLLLNHGGQPHVAQV